MEKQFKNQGEQTGVDSEHIFYFFFIPVLALLCCPSIFADNYREGDSLYVVCQGKLMMRAKANLNAPVLAKVDAGEKVVVANTFGFAAEHRDTIDGLPGSWIYAFHGSETGYVFDAYLSHFPIVGELEYADKFNKSPSLDFLPMLFEEYIEKAIGVQGCKIYYNNGSDGEGSHGMTLVELVDGNKMIKHQFWEGSATELELKNARDVEIYHLLIDIFSKIEVIKERTELTFEKVIGIKQSDYEVTLAKMYRERIVFAKRKDIFTTSIYLIFPCC